MTDLQRAKALLKDGEYTCVLCRGETEYCSSARGVAPMVTHLNGNVDLRGFSAADKVVGKAAALLFSLAGVAEVYADVMSEAAIGVLKRYGIPFSYGKLTDHIINRMGTGLCPMEETVRNIDDPKTALCEIQMTMERLRSRGE